MFYQGYINIGNHFDTVVDFPPANNDTANDTSPNHSNHVNLIVGASSFDDIFVRLRPISWSNHLGRQA